MIAFTSSLKIGKKKDAEELLNELKVLAKKRVLVGVPASEDDREDGSEFGNAARAYVHDNGAPSVGIPARPFMKPGIEKVQNKINTELKTAAKAKLDGTEAGVDLALNNAGFIAMNSIHKIIEEGVGFVPLKRETKLGRIRERKYLKEKFKKNKKLKEEYMSSLHPLINIGEMLKSITYVIEECDK